MAIQAAVGSKLFTLKQLDDAERTSGKEISDFLAKRDVDKRFSIQVEKDLVLDHADLAQARDAESDTVPFTGIGPGKPLTLVIETVYIGDYPDTVKVLPGRQKGDILVTSAHKAFQNVEAAQRAVHLLEPIAERNSYLDFHATSIGSRLVHYSPAVTDMSVKFTFELSSDRDFDDKLGDSLKTALAGAGALPVFAPAAPYLVVAGAAVPIAKKAVDMLARPDTFYKEGVEINLSRPGLRRTQARAFVLYRGQDASPFTEKYELGEGWLLRDRESGDSYDGPVPYVVLSVDGTEHSELAEWSAQAASALLLERFFKPDALISKSLEIATEALSLYSDSVHRKKANEALTAAESAPTEAMRAEKMALYEAFMKNIRDDGIRASARKSDATTVS